MDGLVTHGIVAFSAIGAHHAIVFYQSTNGGSNAMTPAAMATQLHFTKLSMDQIPSRAIINP